jgi:hypothetical protein
MNKLNFTNPLMKQSTNHKPQTTNHKAQSYISKFLLLFIAALSLTNCQVEEIATDENSIKTVSKEEAMLFLQQQGKTINLNGNSANYDYNLRKITQEKLTNTAELLTVVPIITKLKKTKSKALLIKVATKIQTIIYTEYHEESSKTNSFSGTILLTKLNGDFIRAYKLKNNEYVIDLIPANTPNSKFLNVNSFELNEVIIINSYKKPSWGYVPIIFQDTQTTPSISDLENYWWLRSGGGGGIAEEVDVANEIEENIDDSGLDPCPKKVLDKLKIGSTDISKILNDLGASNLIFINIKSDSTIQNPANSTPINGTINNYNIFISSNYTSATDLFRASNILHEITHCYFFSLVDQYTATKNPAIFNDFPTLFQNFVDNSYPGSTESAHHDEMAQKYVKIIGAALQEFQTGLPVPTNHEPLQAYKDLAWGGLQRAPIFAKKFPVGSEDYIRILARYGAESTGRTVNGQTVVGNPCN